MKRLKSFGYLLVAIALSACQQIDLSNEGKDTGDGSTFAFRLYTEAPQTRASSVADFRNIIVVDIVDGTVEQIMVQPENDEEFGHPSLFLSKGQHTLRFMATDADIDRDVATITQLPLGDTFIRSITLNTETAPTSQQVVLERYVARILNKRTETVTLTKTYNTINLKDISVSPTADEVDIEPDMSVLSYAPSSGVLNLRNGKNIPIARNQVTTITENGSEGGEILLGETLALTNDTANFYVAEMEIRNVSLSQVSNPSVTYASQMQPYRIPTRFEATALKEVFAMPAGYWSGDRCLCWDDPADEGKKRSTGAGGYGTGLWYTFLWESGTSVTQAGQKASYSIKPIRHVPIVPIERTYTIDGDFEWSTDTIKVE